MDPIQTAVKLSQPFDVLFTADSSPLSYALRMLQGSFDYSHVCMIGPGGMVYTTGVWQRGAFRFGVVPLEQYLKGKRFGIYRYAGAEGGLSERQHERMEGYFRSKMGTPYPFKKVIQHIAIGFLGRGVRSYPAKEDWVFCAESVAAAFRQAGIILNERARNAALYGYDVREIWEDDRLSPVFLSV